MKLFIQNIFYRFYILFRSVRDEIDSSILSILVLTIFILLYLFLISQLIRKIFSLEVLYIPITSVTSFSIGIIFILIFVLLLILINFKPGYKKGIIENFKNETEKEATKYSWWFGFFLLFTFLAFIGLVLLN